MIDYKFFCFRGKAEYLYIIAGREVGEKAGFGIFDADYKKLNVIRADLLINTGFKIVQKEYSKTDKWKLIKKSLNKQDISEGCCLMVEKGDE